MRWIGRCARWPDNHDGLITALATIVIAYLTYSLANDSARQADISQGTLKAIEGQLDTMRLDQRAWIGGPDASYKDGIATFVFTNTGKTPTTGLYINGDLADKRNWFTVLKEKCAEADRHTRTDDGFKNYSITPGGKHVLHDIYPDEPFSKPEIVSRLRDGDFIIGCVIYSIPFDVERHRTGYAVPINKRPDGTISFGDARTLLPD